MDTILNPSDKSRIIVNLFSNLKLGDLPETFKAFPVKQGGKKADSSQTILEFLKDREVLEEFFPLNSKDRSEY